jgi:hypothetical protein
MKSAWPAVAKGQHDLGGHFVDNVYAILHINTLDSQLDVMLAR